jgi:hypothetical protein
MPKLRHEAVVEIFAITKDAAHSSAKTIRTGHPGWNLIPLISGIGRTPCLPREGARFGAELVLLRIITRELTLGTHEARMFALAAMATLDTWFDRAITATSLDEVFAELQIRSSLARIASSRDTRLPLPHPTQALSSHPAGTRTRPVSRSSITPCPMILSLTSSRSIACTACVSTSSVCIILSWKPQAGFNSCLPQVPCAADKAFTQRRNDITGLAAFTR